jgi:hypothetical protein
MRYGLAVCAAVIALAIPASVRANTITFSALTGPTNLSVGEAGTYNVDILSFLTTTSFFTGGEVTESAIGATVVFDSGNGQTVTWSASSPFAFPPILFSATFAFNSPGTYFVTASKTQVEQDATTIYSPLSTTSTEFTETNVDRLQVTVTAPVAAVPEPGSISLLGIGIACAGLMIGFQKYRDAGLIA